MTGTTIAALPEVHRSPVPCIINQHMVGVTTLSIVQGESTYCRGLQISEIWIDQLKSVKAKSRVSQVCRILY